MVVVIFVWFLFFFLALRWKDRLGQDGTFFLCMDGIGGWSLGRDSTVRGDGEGAETLIIRGIWLRVELCVIRKRGIVIMGMKYG